MIKLVMTGRPSALPPVLPGLSFTFGGGRKGVEDVGRKRRGASVTILQPVGHGTILKERKGKEWKDGRKAETNEQTKEGRK